MELVGHDFYLFVDKETKAPSVVYRRDGWTYGVISLDQTCEPDIPPRKSKSSPTVPRMSPPAHKLGQTIRRRD